MSQLTLTKTYADTELLFKSDIDDMLTELETKVNGGIDGDNLATGWATLASLTLAQDTTFTFGATDTGYVKYTSSTDVLTWGNLSPGEHTIFKVENAEAARIDGTSNDFNVQKDVFFKDRNTTYGLFRLLGTYQKPVLVYVDADEIDVENNTETEHQTLIVFPSGPIAVTEDTSSTHKFRRLVTSATANGYISTHTGAADSGLRVGLSLAASTWYFIYAVRVQYGDDAGNKFILVVDDTSPVYSNGSTLNTRYGTGEWVYLGTIRRGYGVSASTTLVAFQQDHQGWTYFTDRGASANYFGIEENNPIISSSSNSAAWTMSVGNTTTSIPANIVAVQVEVQSTCDADTDMGACFDFGLSTTSIMSHLPSCEFVSESGGQHSFSIVVPVIANAVLAARRHSVSTDDYSLEVYVSGFLDHYV